MTALLGTISGRFSKGLVLGAFFPTVFFVLLNLHLLGRFIPGGWAPLQALAALDREWQTLAVSGLSILFAGLLYTLNGPIVRFYAGYPWRESLLGEWMAGRMRRRLRLTRSQWAGARVAAREFGAGDPRTKHLNVLRNRLGQRVNGEYPIAEASVLPTRLGNVIRSFEDYPQRQYGMGGVTLWPRLAAVIDKEFTVVIDEAKTSFDFMINVAALSSFSAALLLLAGVANPPAVAEAPGAWIVQMAALMFLAYAFYRASIGQAMAWGSTVRAAFDLYRGTLLAKLGFAEPPAGLAEERRVWQAISLQLVYGDPPPHLGSLLRYRGGA